MSRNYFNFLLPTFLLLFVAGCKTYYPVTETSSIVKIKNNDIADSNIVTYYRPFKDSLDKLMKIPLATLENDLYKKQPESTLGNMVVDILKAKAADYTHQTIDVAILNYGGIRMPSLTKGTLKVEDAYLLMPFDNYVVVQVLTGKQVISFCDSIAQKNGWPVSGISFQIANNKAINCTINNKPIDENKLYKIALIDYVANGGDGMAFLKTIPQQQTGKLFREAIIEYWTEQTKAGKPISASLEKRITHAE